jgi:hypothetical protein
VGTGQSTSDTSRASFTGAAQTAVADTSEWFADVIVRSTGASGVCAVSLSMSHNLASTGFANIATQSFSSVTSGFDLTAAGSYMGWSVNPGASGVWTVVSASVCAFNLIG